MKSPQFQFSLRSGLLAFGAAGALHLAGAQTLSSPIAAPAAPAAPSSAKSGSATFANSGVPGGAPTGALGAGAGYHSPNSPIAPLPARTDVVPWALLADIKVKTEKNKVVPVFSSSQLALSDKNQRIQGFMMPLEPGEKQKHFLVTSVLLVLPAGRPGEHG
jgi:uncharacterized protein